MSFIGHAISGVADAVGSVFNDVKGFAAPVLEGIGTLTGQPELTAAGGLLSASGAFSSSGVTEAGGLASVAEQIIGGLGSQINTGFGGFLDDVAGITSKINSFVDTVAGDIDAVIKPIQSVVSDIDKIVTNINDKLISPIVSIVTGTITTYENILTSIHTDIHAGLAGLARLPGDIAGELQGLDSTFTRAVSQLGAHNEDIVNNNLVPGLGNVVGLPITNIHTVLKSAFEFTQGDAVRLDSVGLGETVDLKSREDALNDYVRALSAPQKWYDYLAATLVDVARAVEGINAGSEWFFQAVKQQAYRNQPVTPLGAGDVIRGLYRKTITPDEAQQEMLLHGISTERTQLLIDNEQYLFNEHDATDGWYRGVISDEQWKILIEQNGLDEGQGQVLKDLMLHLISPADIARAEARDIITHEEALELYQRNRVSSGTAQLIARLEVPPVAPREYLDMVARLDASEHGFFTESLKSTPPEILADAYFKAQRSQEQLELDWIAHWKIPDIRTWLNLYYRGKRTFSEFETACRVLNIPGESIQDQIDAGRPIADDWMIGSAYGSGLFSESDARTLLQQSGYGDLSISAVLAYGKAMLDASAASQAATAHNITATTAKELFDDGAWSADQYIQALVALGYEPNAAQLTVEAEQLKQAVASRKLQATGIIDQVKLGVSTAQDALSQLYLLGFTDAEVSGYALQLEQAVNANNKLPTTSQLNDMLKKAIIDVPTWLDTMALLGYNQTWSERLLQLVMPNDSNNT